MAFPIVYPESLLCNSLQLPENCIHNSQMICTTVWFLLKPWYLKVGYLLNSNNLWIKYTLNLKSQKIDRKTEFFGNTTPLQLKISLCKYIDWLEVHTCIRKEVEHYSVSDEEAVVRGRRSQPLQIGNRNFT